MKRYRLDGNGIPVEEPDTIEWARWMDANKDAIRVRETKLMSGVWISTVFLGTDQSWKGGPPILWETMIFGGPLDEVQERCSGAWADAVRQHVRAVEDAIAAESNAAAK